MIILDNTDLTHNISVYVRQEITSCVCTITDEETKISTNLDITGTTTDGIFTFILTYTFINNRYYLLELFKSDVNINKSKIFTTTQSDLEAFTTNNSFYTTITKDAKTYKVKQ